MMPKVDTIALSRELLAAYNSGAMIESPPSARDPDFDMNAAYRVEEESAESGRAPGHWLEGRLRE